MNNCGFCGGENKDIRDFDNISLCPYCANSYTISTCPEFKDNPKYHDIKHLNNMMNLLENRINNK